MTRERQHQRADQRKEHRLGHRAKQLAFDPFEREDRQIDDHDDQFAEHRRLADFDAGVAHDVDRRSAAGWASDRCRTEFSTMITELSTMMPKSIAPRLIRLPAMPDLQHQVAGEQERQRESTVATISPARNPPPRANSAATTSNGAHETNCASAVASTASTSVGAHQHFVDLARPRAACV